MSHSDKYSKKTSTIWIGLHINDFIKLRIMYFFVGVTFGVT